MLLGKNTKQVVRYSHDELTVFGITRGLSLEEIMHWINALLERGFLEKDKGRYPTLSTTKEGWEFLNSGNQIQLTAPKRDAENPTGPAGEEIPPNPELFEKLRALRKRIADERAVPPYVIFSNAALLMMAGRVPRSREDFAKISGVGRVKLEQFSGPFLGAITDYVKACEQMGKEVAVQPLSRPRERNRRSKPSRGTCRETGELISKKLSISDIAKHCGLAESTIRGHLERLITSGEELDIDYLMPSPDRIAIIEAAFQQTGDYKLAPVRELLGEEHASGELALVRIGMRKKGA